MMNALARITINLVIMLSSGLAWSQQKVIFGRFNSRALFTQATGACPAPLVIMVPGSGANGPEEMMPGSITGDGKEHSLFRSFSKGLTSKGLVGTLAIGKPGVEFFKSWEPQDYFYDKNQYENLSWQHLINNLSDAVEFAATLPCVDPNNLVVLGHSEGTQVAVDYTGQFPSRIRSLILLGFSGENLATTVDWQLFRRPIDSWLMPDVDTNHDGFISRAEAKAWPEYQWHWEPHQKRASFAEIESSLRANSSLQKIYQQASIAKIWQGVFHRTPVYEEASKLSQNIYALTGELDVQTRPEEALKLGKACSFKQKLNCEVHLVPGLGHGMSRPKGPRRQKYLDSTLGPVEDSFVKILERVSERL